MIFCLVFNDKYAKIISTTLLLVGSVQTKLLPLLINYVLQSIMSKDRNRVILIL